MLRDIARRPRNIFFPQNTALFDKIRAAAVLVLPCEGQAKGGESVRSKAVRWLTVPLAALAVFTAQVFISAASPAGAETGSDYIPVSAVTSCSQNSTEGFADAEWSAYLSAYSRAREAECLAAGLPSGAWRDGAEMAEDAVYGCADGMTRQRLGEIARKYGLELCGAAAEDSERELSISAATENLRTLYAYENGAFGLSGRVDLSGWMCDFVYEECPVGVMGFWSRSGEQLDKYSQWRYSPPDGAPVWIDMGAANSGGYSGYRQVLLYRRSGERLITVRGSVPNDRDGAEEFADSFFTQ